MKKEEHLTMIPVRSLRPHPDNPRKDLGDLSELSASIEENGIMQNLTAVREDDGTFTVLIGHRRLAAAKMAGISEVPVRIVEDIDLKDQIAIMLEENMQRSDLTVIEEAQSFQMMLDLGDSVNDIVRKTGFSKPTVKHRIEIAKLDEELVAEAVYDYSMTLSDLAELEKIDDVEVRNKILAGSKQKWQIVNAVSDYQRKKKREAALDRLLPMIEKAGIKRDKSYHSWSSGFTTVKQFRLEDLPDEIEIPEGENLRWNYPDDGWNGTVYIFTKDPKPDKSEEEKKQEQERKNIQRIDEIHERMSKNLRSFILKVVDGTFKVPKCKEAEVWSGLWPGIKNANNFYIPSSFIDAFFEDASMDQKPVSALIEAMIYVFGYVETNCSIRNYSGYFIKERAAEIVEMLEVFEGLGFVQDDPEIDQMLDGSLSCYKREE